MPSKLLLRQCSYLCETLNACNRVFYGHVYILANFQISERGTNERKKFKKRNIPKFPIHYYTKIAAKTGTHDKIILFFASKRGTVPPKEEQLASMCVHFPKTIQMVVGCTGQKGPCFIKFLKPRVPA